VLVTVAVAIMVLKISTIFIRMYTTMVRLRSAADSEDAWIRERRTDHVSQIFHVHIVT